MIITIYNKKGGVGKTSLSYNLARDLNFFMLSNDDSIIEKAYPNKAKILERIKVIEDQNIIYDLGGFVDSNAVEVFKKSDLIIVPTIADVNSIKRTVNTVKELETFNTNIIVIGNIIKSENDIGFIQQYLKADFFIAESKIFQKSLLEQSSVLEIVYKTKIDLYRYRKVLKGYETLLNYLKDFKGV